MLVAEGFWTVRLSGNWRIVFRFEGGDANTSTCGITIEEVAYAMANPPTQAAQVPWVTLEDEAQLSPY